MGDNVLILNEDEFRRITMTSDAKLVYKFLRDKKYYNMLMRIFSDRLSYFCVKCEDNGEISTFNKRSIIKIIKFYYDRLNNDDKRRVQRLRKLVFFEALKEEYEGITYRTGLLDKVLYYTSDDFFDFLSLPDDEYKKVLSSTEFHGIKLDEFLYVLKLFFTNKKILDNFYFDRKMFGRIKEIFSYQVCDFQSINYLNETTNDEVKGVKPSQKLLDEIGTVPEEFTLLEKAIYLYIKLCTIISYDREYYAVNQRGDSVKKHQKVSYVSKIKSEAVCFEFNIIYAYLLDKLGIPFEIYPSLDSYGEGHSYLIFIVDKYIVRADAVTSILDGDLFASKTGNSLEGLACLNKNCDTASKFNEAFSRVYDYIRDSLDYRAKFYQKVSNLDELIKIFGKHNPVISFEERVKMLIEYVSYSNLEGMDAFSYLLYLRKQLFSTSELNKIDIRIVKNNAPSAKKREAMPIAVITVKKRVKDKPIYMIYEPKSDVVMCSREELNSYFDDSLFDYIDENDIGEITGIRL